MTDFTLDEQQLEALRPLAAVIEGAIKDTPIRLGTDDWGTMLASGILVRVAAYMGGVVPPVTDDATTPATTCSAEYHGPGHPPTRCIRAGHHESPRHTDEGGFHWSNALAVYPTDPGEVKVSMPFPRSAELIEDERVLREYEAAGDEDAQRAARRYSVRSLLSRLERGVILDTERVLLRQLVETEIREHDTMRSVAAGNKRHVQVMYAELEKAEGAARRALEQRQEMAEERYVIQGQRDTADRLRDNAQRDRDQHAAVLGEVLDRFRAADGGHLEAYATRETLDQWRSVVAPTAERPWWEQVADAREQAAALAEDLRYVLNYRGPGHAHAQPGLWDTSGEPCEHCARLTAARQHLAAYDTGPDAALPEPAEAEALIEEYLRFLRGQGPEPDLSGLPEKQRATVAGQFEIVKALADRDPELPPLDRDPVARRLGLHADEKPDPETQPASPCSAVHLRVHHAPHGWEPQPGMDRIPCPGYPHATEARQDGAPRPTLRERHRAEWNTLTPDEQAARIAALDADDTGAQKDGASS